MTAKRKPVKRKDGRPTRADKSRVNKAAFSQSKKDFKLYMPPSARARYEAMIDQMKAEGKIEGPVEQQKAILSLVIGGLSLRWAREIVGVRHGVWHEWLRDNEELRKEYNLAKEERTEAWADDIMEDAEQANAFNVQAIRLRIETKKWLMGKNSGRYADKVVLAGDPANPLRTITREMSQEEAQESYAQMKGQT
jgi:hypothetical protein